MMTDTIEAPSHDQPLIDPKQPRIVRLCRCDLTEDQVNAKAGQLCAAMRAKDQIKRSAKVAAEGFKKLAAEQEELIERLQRDIEERSEERPIQCFEEHSFRDGVVYTRRSDTKESVGDRPMTIDERQRDLKELWDEGAAHVAQHGMGDDVAGDTEPAQGSDPDTVASDDVDSAPVPNFAGDDEDEDDAVELSAEAMADDATAPATFPCPGEGWAQPSTAATEPAIDQVWVYNDKRVAGRVLRIEVITDTLVTGKIGECKRDEQTDALPTAARWFNAAEIAWTNKNVSIGRDRFLPRDDAGGRKLQSFLLLIEAGKS